MQPPSTQDQKRPPRNPLHVGHLEGIATSQYLKIHGHYLKVLQYMRLEAL